MEILALGMSRAGTESIKQALEQIGHGPVYHGWELNKPQNRDHGLVWGDLTRRKYGSGTSPIVREDFDQILGTYRGVTETPCIAFWEELMDAYPDAKILLVDRDLEEWYRSFENVVIPTLFSWQKDVLTLGMAIGLVPRSPNWFYEALFKGLFRANNASEMKQNARHVYAEHYAAIEKKARAESRDFLRMDLRDGWQPLCGWLEKPVPMHEFPRTNLGWKTVEQVKAFRGMAMTKLLKQVGGICGITAAVASVSCFAWRWTGVMRE